MRESGREVIVARGSVNSAPSSGRTDRLGEITGGDTERALIDEADQWMSAQGVMYPERLTRVLTP